MATSGSAANSRPGALNNKVTCSCADDLVSLCGGLTWWRGGVAGSAAASQQEVLNSVPAGGGSLGGAVSVLVLWFRNIFQGLVSSQSRRPGPGPGPGLWCCFTEEGGSELSCGHVAMNPIISTPRSDTPAAPTILDCVRLTSPRTQPKQSVFPGSTIKRLQPDTNFKLRCVPVASRAAREATGVPRALCAP